MRVFVTGADGFIGSHLVESLIDKGYEVNAFCLYNSFGSWGWLDNLDSEKKKSINVILGDIKDIDSIREGMKGCEIVFHLAALIAIPYSYISPSSYVDTNIKGTLNILHLKQEHEIYNFRQDDLHLHKMQTLKLQLILALYLNELGFECNLKNKDFVLSFQTPLLILSFL